MAVVIVSVTACLPCVAAFGATLGLVGIASGLEQLLLVSAESELLPTVGTFERLVLKRHWMTSSLLYSVRVLVTQYVRQTVKFNQICDNQYL